MLVPDESAGWYDGSHHAGTERVSIVTPCLSRTPCPAPYTGRV